MGDEERSALESKRALDKVESNLEEARRLYDDGQELEKANGHAVAAREACGQMAQYMSARLLPLVNEAVESLEDRRLSGQIDVPIHNALTEVNTLRSTLGSVED